MRHKQDTFLNEAMLLWCQCGKGVASQRGRMLNRKSAVAISALGPLVSSRQWKILTG